MRGIRKWHLKGLPRGPNTHYCPGMFNPLKTRQQQTQLTTHSTSTWPRWFHVKTKASKPKQAESSSGQTRGRQWLHKGVREIGPAPEADIDCTQEAPHKGTLPARNPKAKTRNTKSKWMADFYRDPNLKFHHIQVST